MFCLKLRNNKPQMRASKNTKYGIQSVDFLGSKFKIGYSTVTGKFQTKLGGYLTILMGLLSTSMFFVVMSQYFSKAAPVVMTSSESGSRENSFNLYEGNLYLPILLTLGPIGIPAAQVRRYATIKAFVEMLHFKPQSNTHAFNITPFMSFDYKPCSEIEDPHMKAYVDSFVSLPGFRDAIWCPDFRGLHKEFVSSVSYITYISRWASVKIYPCSLPDPSQCAPISELNIMKAEYGYPSKLLKPSDYKNPVDNAPIRRAIHVDPRSIKMIKELVVLNRVFDDTMSLVPPQLKEEYTTLQQESIDTRVRDHTQLHCSKVEIDKGYLGKCLEYIFFEYYPSEEVLVTTRSYKSLTAMLGEFGGVLKIITTAAFFVYGVYSMKKVKSVLGGIIFENNEGSEKQLRELVDRKDEGLKKTTQVNKIHDNRGMKATPNQLKFQKLVERFVSRRSNVDNLMQKLNLLELIEKALFKKHEKALLPLVLLNAEKTELEEQMKRGEAQSDHLEGVQIKGKERNPKNTIMNKENPSQPTEEEEFSYQVEFDNLLNSKPDSAFSQIIKEYMISQLEGTFKDSQDQSSKNYHKKVYKEHRSNQNPRKKFRKNRPQKFDIFKQTFHREDAEEVESPKKNLKRKKEKSGTGFMRPTNSPMRIKTRSKKGSLSKNSQSSSSLNLKSINTPPGHRE